MKPEALSGFIVLYFIIAVLFHAMLSVHKNSLRFLCRLTENPDFIRSKEKTRQKNSRFYCRKIKKTASRVKTGSGFDILL